jgi:sulfur carrier protein
MADIKIFLNGEIRQLAGEIDLDRLLDYFSLPKQRIAVEINKAVIRRPDWPHTLINDNDKIEVVHFVGGG